MKTHYLTRTDIENLSHQVDVRKIGKGRFIATIGNKPVLIHASKYEARSLSINARAGN